MRPGAKAKRERQERALKRLEEKLGPNFTVPPPTELASTYDQWQALKAAMAPRGTS